MALKVTSLLAFFLSACTGSAVACAGDDAHHHSHGVRRTYPSPAHSPPTRPLEWGDVNIIHTTDSHGWLIGHQKTSWPEPNYSGDLGDFASFVEHMKNIAIEKDADLLLVDSGDLHDGTGLSDGYPAGGVDGHESNKFMLELPYDVMAIGNHELYHYPVTWDMYKNFAPKLNGRYLTSNAYITVADQHGNPTSVPVGERFAKFRTRKGRKVPALGVMFESTSNDKNTTVQKVEDMVNESWFKKAIEDDPDFFLLAGHMPVQNDKWPVVFDVIRAKHRTTPILILGGHTHIRDCMQPDGRSMALESGRYMETVGWMSVKLDDHGSQNNLTFSRRYLDPNRVTYEFHTGQNNHTFDTLSGRFITNGLKHLYKKFNLDALFGTAPQDYTLNQSPYPTNSSLLTLLGAQANPMALGLNNTRAQIPNVIITNSGSLRFDLYAGPFNRNDEITASPFVDYFLYIPNISAGIASQVLPALNHVGEGKKRRTLDQGLSFARGLIDHVYRGWLKYMHEAFHDHNDGHSHGGAPKTTLGYVTKDSCPGAGDDIVHTPLPFYETPDFIASDPPNVSDDTPIDLVFVDFIEDQLLGILNSLQNDKTYTTADVSQYSSVDTTDVLGIYAQHVWN